MEIYEQLNQALKQSGLAELQDASAYQKIGNGAWHNAYLVTTKDQQKWVVRVRKKIIYGRERAFDEGKLKAEYESVGLYYQRGNQVEDGICPRVYHYQVNSEITYTLETYLGPCLSIANFSPRHASVYGRQIGEIFQELHRLPAEIQGYGELTWNGKALVCSDQRSKKEIWSEEKEILLQRMEELAASQLEFDREGTSKKLQKAIDGSTFVEEPFTMANVDITPENLLCEDNQFSGLIDPIPYIDNGTRWAAFFMFCYQFLLPVYHEAPRYSRHQYHRHRPTMNALSTGFMAGYTNGETIALMSRLQEEYYLQLFELTYDCYQDLELKELDEETYLRKGDQKAIARRLEACLAELERFPL